MKLTKEQILKGVIEKAIKNGWDEMKIKCLVFGRGKIAGKYKSILDMKGLPYECFIFSHDFAKAFWGEEEFDERENKQEFWWADDLGAVFNGKRWQYHLQVMVLEPDPLLYLKDYL